MDCNLKKLAQLFQVVSLGLGKTRSKIFMVIYGLLSVRKFICCDMSISVVHDKGELITTLAHAVLTKPEQNPGDKP